MRLLTATMLNMGVDSESKRMHTRAEYLNVWIGQRKVGIIVEFGDQNLGFQYADKWRCSSDAYPISISLPLSATVDRPLANPFFSNLLPEDDGLIRLLARLGKRVDRKGQYSHFALLELIGGDCAGALSFLPPDTTPVAGRNRYAEIPTSELLRIIAPSGSEVDSAGWSPLQSYRGSLAGAQDKIGVLVDSGRIYLPLDGSPSSHLLKINGDEWPLMLEHEWLGMRTAQEIGLPVAHFELKDCQGLRYALVERYDRFRDGTGTLRRLHQEDFCQVLGYRSTMKYQDAGGPTLQNVAQLLHSISSNTITDIKNLIQWQAFNIYAGNADGHAKNIAILRRENGTITLAPFYDLVLTRAYPALGRKSAFSVGTQYSAGTIGARQWRKLANWCRVPEQEVMEVVQDIAERLPRTFRLARQEFEDRYGPLSRTARTISLDEVDAQIQRDCDFALRL